MAHTKCISEAEKYSGKDYVPKASLNKGQRKQEAWTDVIEKVLSRSDLSQSVRSTLNLLTKHENVPRKRPKFANFMKNVSRGTSVPDVNKVFDLIEEAFKAEKDEQLAAQAKVKEEKANGTEKEDDSLKRKSNDPEDEPATEEPSKKKKKKREAAAEEENGEAAVAENGNSGEPKKKKKKKAKAAVEETNGTDENGKAEEPGFCWKETIRSIVAEKDNSVSMKKLQTKVLKAYKKQTGDTETVTDQTIEVVLKRKLKKMKNISIEEDRVVIKA